MGLQETKEAIEAAKQAFKTWSKTTAKVGYVYISSELDPDRQCNIARNAMTC